MKTLLPSGSNRSHEDSHAREHWRSLSGVFGARHLSVVTGAPGGPLVKDQNAPHVEGCQGCADSCRREMLIHCVTHREATSYERESARTLHLVARCGVSSVCRYFEPEKRPDRLWDFQWPYSPGDPVYRYRWKDADLPLSGSGEFELRPGPRPTATRTLSAHYCPSRYRSL